MKDTFTWNLQYNAVGVAAPVLNFFWATNWKPQYKTRILSIIQWAGAITVPGGVETALFSEWALSSANAGNVWDSPDANELAGLPGTVVSAPYAANLIFAPDSPKIITPDLVLPQVAAGQYAMAASLFKADGTNFNATDNIVAHLMLTLEREF